MSFFDFSAASLTKFVIKKTINLTDKLLMLQKEETKMIKKATLINENEKLKRSLFIWENIGIGISSSTKEKEIASKNFLDEHKDYSLYEVSSTIKLPKGTLYNYIFNKVEKPWFKLREDELYEEILKIFEQSRKIYGADRIVVALRKKNILTSSKTVLNIMKKFNMIKNNNQKRPRKDSKRPERNYSRNLLKREFNQDAPNKVWACDFLEINVRGVKFSLCVILDLYARKVIAWRLSHKRSVNLAINTFKDAFETRNEPQDLIFHTDQGAEFTSNVFIETLEMLGVKQSFSYPGSPNDNACMESFYGTLRREEININIDKYGNSLIIRQYLSSYFDFYNENRMHTSNDGMSPNEKEEKWLENHRE